MTGRQRRLTREARAGVGRAVRTDRVGVAFVDFARSHMDTVHGWESALLRLVTQVRQLLVDEMAGVANARAARSGRRHARAVQRLVRNRREGNDVFRDLPLAHDRLERHLRQLVREILLLEKVEQRRKARDRVRVEVAAYRDPYLAGNLADVLDDLVKGALAAAQRTHLVVHVAVAIEGHFYIAKPVGQQAIDQLFGEQ